MKAEGALTSAKDEDIPAGMGYTDVLRAARVAAGGTLYRTTFVL